MTGRTGCSTSSPTAPFDHDLARDRLAAWTASELADNKTVLIVDETGDEKSSTDCVDASRLYSGALGGVGLCQVAVHLTYASERGHALIDRQPYLPAGWAEDEERRLLRHVPDEIGFATKGQLAAAMLARARDLGIAARWFAGDEVYGSLELRRTARTLGVRLRPGRQGRPPRRHTAVQLAAKVPAQAWMRLRTGHGTKGDRHYDCALIDVLPEATPDGHARDGQAFLVVRRHRYTRELSFYRCHSARLVTLVHIICTRWRIEKDFQSAKGLAGLDAVTHARHPHRRRRRSTRPGQQPRTPGHHAVTALPAPRRDLGHVLHWSAWRRRHQHQATAAHGRWNNNTTTVAAAT
ncbi:IS701 family transposase [Streptomyces violaceusniger]